MFLIEGIGLADLGTFSRPSTSSGRFARPNDLHEPLCIYSFSGMYIRTRNTDHFSLPLPSLQAQCLLSELSVCPHILAFTSRPRSCESPWPWALPSSLGLSHSLPAIYTASESFKVILVLFTIFTRPVSLISSTESPGN